MQTCCNYFDLAGSCVTACPPGSTPNAEFLCVCSPGFLRSRDSCFDVDECQAIFSLCANGGTCMNTPGSFTCNCAPGFTGTTCSTDVDECQSSPCQNGGTCTDLLNAFLCDCVAGYAGRTCETNINECTGDLCQNGGTCTDLVNDFFCVCEAEFTGELCEINLRKFIFFTSLSQSFIHTILTVPPSPPLVTAPIATATTVTITWALPRANTVHSYLVSWSCAGPCSGPGPGPATASSALSASSASFVISDLRPNAQYLVTLDAINSVGSTRSEVMANTSVIKGKFQFLQL